LTGTEEMIMGRSTSTTDRTHHELTPWDPHRGERIGPVWDRILTTLGDGRWHPWTAVIDEVVPGSDVQVKTINNLIYSGLRNGHLVKKGQYFRKTRKDTRFIRLNQHTNDSSEITTRGADR
jgi:hypothetical protein